MLLELFRLLGGKMFWNRHETQQIIDINRLGHQSFLGIVSRALFLNIFTQTLEQFYL